MNPSISSLQIARIRGSSFFIASGVNGGSSNCLAGLCTGGSEVIGGAAFLATSGRTSRTMIRRDEKCSVSLAISRTAS